MHVKRVCAVKRTREDVGESVDSDADRKSFYKEF